MANVQTGYPKFLSEMTLLTALRTAATSAMAARHLARPNSRVMAVIGLGAQSEFQQMLSDFPVTELWRVMVGEAVGRKSSDEITIFDSVGFVTEDFSALRYLYDRSGDTGLYVDVDLLTAPSNPRNLYSLLMS